jgi:hypothetical protein
MDWKMYNELFSMLFPISAMATLASTQKHKQFFSKKTDNNLSVLFAFFRTVNKAKSALLMQK